MLFHDELARQRRRHLLNEAANARRAGLLVALRRARRRAERASTRLRQVLSQAYQTY